MSSGSQLEKSPQSPFLNPITTAQEYGQNSSFINVSLTLNSCISALLWIDKVVKCCIMGSGDKVTQIKKGKSFEVSYYMMHKPAVPMKYISLVFWYSSGMASLARSKSGWR